MKKLLLLLAVTASPGWSQQARVTLNSDKSSYFLGENVLIHFSVENLGPGPLGVDLGGDYRGAPRSLRFKVKAFDEHGQLLEDPHPNPMCFGGLGGKTEVKPGKAFVTSLALAHYRRIPQAGKYHIVVSHDLGWKSPASASTDLEFKHPSPQQAEAIVQAMAATPLNQGVSWGQKSPDYRDFWTLSYPIYLEPLEKLAASQPEALIGIGQTPVIAAVPSLRTLACNPKLKLEASRQLCLRLPERGQKQPGFGSEERARLARLGWSPAFAWPVGALARELIGMSDEYVCQGAFMLARIGQADDLPALLQCLERYLPAVSSYPRPAGPGDQLERAVAALPWPKKFPTPPAIRGAWLLKRLLEKPGPPMIQKGLVDSSGRVRELAILAIPSAQVRSYRDRLKLLLHDADPGVQVAVCDKLAGEAAILELVRATPNEWVLRAAAGACTAKHRWECALALCDRLEEKEHWLVVFQLLADQVMTRVKGNSSNGVPDDSELKILRSRWHQFLTDHKGELEAGRTFAQIPSELIPSNFQFSP